MTKPILSLYLLPIINYINIFCKQIGEGIGITQLLYLWNFWSIKKLNNDCEVNFSIDFEVPNTPVVSEITGLSGEDITYVNAQEIKDSAGFTITGTGEAFAELSVLFSDGFERVTLPEGESLNKTTVNEDGEWSFIISEEDINGTSFGNGTKSFSVSQADAVGNISQSSSNTVFKLDTISPEVALSLDVVELSNNVNAKLNLVFSKIPIGFSSSDINSENVDILKVQHQFQDNLLITGQLNCQNVKFQNS